MTSFKSNNILHTYRIHKDLVMVKFSTELDQRFKSYDFLSNNFVISEIVSEKLDFL